jgi:hypothetical protein
MTRQVAESAGKLSLGDALPLLTVMAAKQDSGVVPAARDRLAASVVRLSSRLRGVNR